MSGGCFAGSLCRANSAALLGRPFGSCTKQGLEGAMQVEQIDRELFITTLNPDSSTAEAVRKGFSYTWEVEQIARHRIAERERVVGEIERWLWETDDDITGILCRMNDRSELTAMLQAKFGGNYGNQ